MDRTKILGLVKILWATLESTALIIMGLSPGVLFLLPKLRPGRFSSLQPRLQSQIGTEMHDIGVILTNFVESDRRRRGLVKI